MSLDFSAVKTWWEALQNDRAARAELRRCASVSEAMNVPATFDLFRSCGGTGPNDLAAIALTAAALAHVRDDDPDMSIARRIGPDDPDKPETALLKPLRFRRLMEAVTEDERLTAFRRLAAIAGRKLNVADLARALLDWSENRQRRWVFDYWNAGNLEPNAAPDNTALGAEKETTP